MARVMDMVALQKWDLVSSNYPVLLLNRDLPTSAATQSHTIDERVCMYACTRYGTGVGFSFPDVVLLPVMPRLELHTERHTERHTEWHTERPTECAINFAFWKISHFVAIFQLVKSIRKMKSFADGKFRLGKLDILKLGKCEICETILQCAKCDILGKIFHHAKFTTKT